MYATTLEGLHVGDRAGWIDAPFTSPVAATIVLARRIPLSRRRQRRTLAAYVGQLSGSVGRVTVAVGGWSRDFGRAVGFVVAALVWCHDTFQLVHGYQCSGVLIEGSGFFRPFSG